MFAINATDSTAYQTNNSSYVERALKRFKNTSGKGRQFEDLRFLLPTSNICERLFSKAGHVLNDPRMALLPANFEVQLFLHLNRDLWSVHDFNQLKVDAQIS